MSTFKAQRGLSAISWLVLLTVVGFFGLCVAKMAPVYAENYYITTGLKSVAQQNAGNLKNMRKSEISRSLNSYYSINNVRSPGAKELEFQSTSRGMLVINRYEVRVPLLANIDVVMSFFNVLDTSAPDLCCDPPEELLESE
ncbi:DUF4845 domain-containing protein [Gilvimarinus sp. SDUM040013]|uniref:DUF4845 domain-containing protein n=1 Tax=Gilvimarinus gilvus TaxID=3058038 RepID=A0ABU4RW06_9GAMM|nr:DUF4845 domain-containing protein [Gilvimarinus sp. SDUM040013]MDO3386483.1 DUF4845 domain-containing protein [Gilvimarinus sp. SDUM040013]MDX6849059.1 DUF4845 domain-containing protein [Gilvimarinus sp. SDUM040013]